MFRAVPLPIIRSFSLCIQHWYKSCRFDDSFRAGAVWNCSSTLLLLESCHQNCMIYTSAECTAKSPDDGQRNCPKHAEFLDKINLGN